MKHILVIEDNDEIRDNIKELLEMDGYRVSGAENGKVGVDMALKETPDLIICDIMMPVLDGYGVLHLVNKNPALPGVPFIFLTAKAERADIRKAMEMGADDYITKPFNDIELLNAIESRLRKAALLRKEYETSFSGMQQMLSEFKGASLETLAAEANTDHYKKKQLIYREGNHPRYLFYLQQGKVKTFKMNEDGKELTIGLYNQGDFFGYNALLEKTVYKESAETIEPSEVAMIPRDQFTEMIDKSPEAAKKFVSMLAKNVSEKEEQLLALAYNSLRKRVADALITLQKKYHKHDGSHFSMHISREDLANIAGTATESIIRTISDFKSEKLIEIRDGDIVIINEQKLANLAN